MRTSLLRFLGTLLAMAVAPAAAIAQQAVISTGANLRAGPGPGYPVVAQLNRGVAVQVAGCTDGYQWCDVLLPGGELRGWVVAQSLAYPYQGQPVPLASYGATLGVPLVTFAIGSYWGAHYRDRPFYREPRYWGGRPPQAYYGRPGWDGGHGGPQPGWHGGPSYNGRPPGARWGGDHRPDGLQGRPDYRPGGGGEHGREPGRSGVGDRGDGGHHGGGSANHGGYRGNGGHDGGGDRGGGDHGGGNRR